MGEKYDDVPEKVRSRREAIRKSVLSWTKANLRSFPWRYNETPYSVFITETAVKRTTATAAARVFPILIEKYPNIKSLSLAQQKDLEDIFKSIGLQHQRSKSLLAACSFIMSEYGGILPKERHLLETIPGIGPYTSGAIQSIGYGVRAAMIDSNAIRIYSRVFNSVLPERGHNKMIHRIGNYLVPTHAHREFNYGLLDIGALVCRYTTPRCDSCSLDKVCDTGLLTNSLN